MPQLKQDKHSLDLYSLLQNFSFQTREGIMTVQFIALFSPPFWWYFQKKNISQKQMGHLPPQHPKFVLPSRRRKHHQAQHLPHDTSFSGVFTCLKLSLPVLKRDHAKNSCCANAMWTGRWGWACTWTIRDNPKLPWVTKGELVSQSQSVERKKDREEEV